MEVGRPCLPYVLQDEGFSSLVFPTDCLAAGDGGVQGGGFRWERMATVSSSIIR